MESQGSRQKTVLECALVIRSALVEMTRLEMNDQQRELVWGESGRIVKALAKIEAAAYAPTTKARGNGSEVPSESGSRDPQIPIPDTAPQDIR